MQQTEVTLFCLELFSGMYCLQRKYSPGRKSGTVGWGGRVQIWHIGLGRMCDVSRKPAWGRFIFGHSLSEEKTGKWFVSAQTHK